MKKFFMMLLALVAMMTTTFTTTSCSEDDSDLAYYTVCASVETGNLPDDEAEVMKNGFAYEKTALMSLSEAKSQFNNIVSQSGSNFKNYIDLCKNRGYTGVSISIFLKDSNGNVISSKTWK